MRIPEWNCCKSIFPSHSRLLEILNVSATLKGSLGLDSVYDAISIFKKMMIRKMGVNFSNSMMLADRHKIYAYDAYFLEVCLKMNAPLLSLDKRLVQVAKMEQIETMEL